LWTGAAGAAPVVRFEPGQGGGAFDIAGNRVVMSSDTEIIRANLDGSGREVVHTFPFINTASEYIYYPVPQWTANGEVAFVAIPSPEPFNNEAEAGVWQILNNGPAVLLTELTGNILFNPVQWADNGNTLAYVRQVIDASNPPLQLYIGSGQGFANLNPYGDEAGQLTFLDWSDDGSHFLYYEQNGGATAYVGAVGAAPVEIDTPGNQILTGRWLTHSTYIIVAGGGNNQRILSGNLDGETAELVEVQTTLNGVDGWVP
jgi:Tol biopolymer transport system component